MNRRLLAIIALLVMLGCGGGSAGPAPSSSTTEDGATGIVGEQYSYQINAAHCSLTSGSLPPGITLNNCTVVGIPTTTGKYTFTVTTQ